MTRQLVGAIGLACLVVVIGVAEAVRSGIVGGAGQTVFVPVVEIDEAEVHSGPTLVVSTCEEGLAGLTVTGHVDASGAHPMVVVTGGREGRAGVRVGKAFAMDAAPWRFTEVGDYVVVIPWATEDSFFAVWSAGRIGPIVRCPGLGRTAEVMLAPSGEPHG